MALPWETIVMECLFKTARARARKVNNVLMCTTDNVKGTARALAYASTEVFAIGLYMFYGERNDNSLLSYTRDICKADNVP